LGDAAMMRARAAVMLAIAQCAVTDIWPSLLWDWSFAANFRLSAIRLAVSLSFAML
jgi:hypothetical protein